MKITLRTRINGRLLDPQDKYRDEITQEIQIELTDADYHGDTFLTFDKLRTIAREQMNDEVHKALVRLEQAGGASYSHAFPPVEEKDHLKPIKLWWEKATLEPDYFDTGALADLEILLYGPDGQPDHLGGLHRKKARDEIAEQEHDGFMLKDCKAQIGSEWETCPIDQYDDIDQVHKGEGLIWMLDNCIGCPKYKKFMEDMK